MFSLKTHRKGFLKKKFKLNSRYFVKILSVDSEELSRHIFPPTIKKQHFININFVPQNYIVWQICYKSKLSCNVNNSNLFSACWEHVLASKRKKKYFNTTIAFRFPSKKYSGNNCLVYGLRSGLFLYMYIVHFLVQEQITVNKVIQKTHDNLIMTSPRQREFDFINCCSNLLVNLRRTFEQKTVESGQIQF